MSEIEIKQPERTGASNDTKSGGMKMIRMSENDSIE